MLRPRTEVEKEQRLAFRYYFVRFIKTRLVFHTVRHRPMFVLFLSTIIVTVAGGFNHFSPTPLAHIRRRKITGDRRKVSVGRTRKRILNRYDFPRRTRNWPNILHAYGSKRYVRTTIVDLGRRGGWMGMVTRYNRNQRFSRRWPRNTLLYTTKCLIKRTRAYELCT